MAEETTVRGLAEWAQARALLGEVDALLQHLALCRQVVQSEKANLQHVNDRIEHIYGSLLRVVKDAIKEAQGAEAAARAELDAAALKLFEATGDKEVHPAVKIRAYTVLDYNEAEALEYAREHLPQALKLDRGAFDRAAKAIDLPFVTAREELRVFTAQHLDEYLI